VVLGRMSWTDLVRNGEALQKVKGERNIVQTIKERKANCIVYVLRRNCLIRDVIEGKEKGNMEVTRRRGRKHKQLLDNLKKSTGT
jgi:hypothetical protein